MKNKLYILLTVSLVWAVAWGVAFAQDGSQASLYFEVNGFDSTRAGDFSIDIMIDSTVNLNAYDVVFKYPENLMELRYVNMADSIVDILPEAVSSDDLGRVVIKGGSVTPFFGGAGLIARLHFRARAVGGSTLGFISARVYVADGSGTVIEPVVYQASGFEISGLLETEEGEPGVVLVNPDSGGGDYDFADSIEPEIITMEVVKDPFDETNLLLVFEGEDGQSGVLHYLVREKQWILFGAQKRVSNPYSIVADSWAIELVVVDNFGNESSKMVYRWKPLAWKFLFLLVLLGGAWVVVKMYGAWRVEKS